MSEMEIPPSDCSFVPVDVDDLDRWFTLVIDNRVQDVFQDEGCDKNSYEL